MSNHTEHLVELTLEMMRIPSPSGGESVLADWVLAQLARTCPAARVDRIGNAVVARLGEDDPRYVLAGHLDTVPHNGQAEPERRGDELVGLGSTDMKGGLAVMLSLAEARAESDPPLALVFYDCEEIDFSRNGLRPVLAEHADLSRADLAILLEPTGNALELGCLGTLHARITVPGVAGHSARPWAGRNAIHAAAPLLTRIAEIPERKVTQGPATFREVLSVTLIEGGRTRNVIPDRCALNVNVRFAPDRTAEAWESTLREWLPENATLEIVDAAPSAPAFSEAPAIARLLEQGLTARAKQAWTDVAQFAGIGVPAVNFGPGIPELAHRQDESVPVENLEVCYRHLRRLVADGDDA